MTRLKIAVNLLYDLSQTTDILSQIRVADLADQIVSSESVFLPDTIRSADVAAENGIGMRSWIRVAGSFRYDYSCSVAIDRPALDIARLDAVAPHLLPGDTVRYLMPSRYCPSDEFQSFVAAEFGHLSGGRKVDAMRRWLCDKFRYASGSSNAQTTALDTFVQRQGACRDFAHVLIALCRASAIPARFVSAYAPDVEPQDFHAVVEVYLDGTWHLIDPTDMAGAADIARIGVGADAAEVAFLSAFAPISLRSQNVSVTRL